MGPLVRWDSFSVLSHLKDPSASNIYLVNTISFKSCSRVNSNDKSKSAVIWEEGIVIIKGHEETAGGMDSFMILIVNAFTSAYESQNLLIVYLKYEQLIVCQLYLNK